MRKTIWAAIIMGLLMWPLCAIGQSLSADDIMDRLETRYSVQGIFVKFHQTSTLKALDVVDTAEGQIYIKQPGRMRWEYETPEKQFIITDGTTVWIHRPDDNQVMMGAAETFFGEGKGGAFLADMTLIRKFFSVERTADDPEGNYVLKLTPGESSENLNAVVLTVSKENFTILQVVTENGYGDETRLTFDTPEFGTELDDALFTFDPSVVEGIEVISLDE